MSFYFGFGPTGSGHGQIGSLPSGIAVASNGDIYVSDRTNNRIVVFDSTGLYLTSWGSLGTADGQFNNPYGLAIDAFDDVYVADRTNNRIQKFTSSGTFITKWGTLGSADGELSAPSALAVGSYVYVIDNGNSRVQKFTTTGTFVDKWGSYGTGDNNFDGPLGIGVNPSTGNVYVADNGNNRIQEFSPTGTFVQTIGSYGTGMGQFTYVNGCVASEDGTHLYSVNQSSGPPISVFSLPSATAVGSISSVASGLTGSRAACIRFGKMYVTQNNAVRAVMVYNIAP